MKSSKLIILLLVAVVLSGCRQESSLGITATGVVDGEVVTVKAAAAGEIEALYLVEGAEIYEGDILAEIDTDKIDNQIQGLHIQSKDIGINRKKLGQKVKLIEKNLAYWKEQVEKFERLQKKESISGDQLEQAKLKLEETETALFDAEQSLRSLAVTEEQLQNQEARLLLLLDDLRIASPVSGIVLEKFVTEGETVFPGSPVADILDRSSLFIESFLEGREISSLKLGQQVDILVDGIENRTFKGTISLFGNEAEFSPKYIISEKERRSLLYLVEIRIEESLEVFKLGMPVTVRITLQNAS